MTTFLLPRSTTNLDASWMSAEEASVSFVPLADPPSPPTSPASAARTIVCEGKLSVRVLPSPTARGDDNVPKLRRRSIDILRNAWASVLTSAGGNGRDTVGAGAVRKVARLDKWTSVHAWLDDAALLHIEGFPSMTGGATVVKVERAKWRMSQDWAVGRKSADHAVTVKVTSAQPRKSLDVWNRRSWSVEAETWNYDEAKSRRPSHPTILFNPITAAQQSTPHTTFRVLSLDRDPSGTILLLHVEPYEDTSVPNMDSPATGQLTTLYLRFKSSAKLDRWRAAFSLALCVAQARSEAEAAQEVERKLAEVDEARKAAEIEKQKVEKKLKKEKKEWEKKVRGMFSAEEVQDVYQETADQLSEAEEKMSQLEAKVAQEQRAKQDLRRELDQLRAATEGPVGEYNTLLLRHEELCRKYEEQKRENVLIRALYEKELAAHKRLAAILRKQASDNVQAAEDVAQAQLQGLLSPPMSPTQLSRSISPVPLSPADTVVSFSGRQ
ncbi:hypothetical protein SpCBS45565_g06334 [Spizellomyces sp. 'palustris']|nr:hypothetical protein SpCBS45565_g06334 [Spizellomyces sp. 'palustris']